MMPRSQALGLAIAAKTGVNALMELDPTYGSQQ
jgi:hypothetical protein